MEQYGNEWYNVERVLRENINNHEYMRRTAREMNSWEEVLDEMYNAVGHVEPWMSGNIRGPSSAFCLLYRLFELKLTEEQIQETLTCSDSVYIRAIGFLYLRYVCQPHNLQSWLEPYFHDETKIWPSGQGMGKQVTIGAFVTDLVLSQNYFETIFIRIPKKITDEIVQYLKDQGLPHVPIGNGGQGGPDRRGGDDGRARPASVKASLSVAVGQRAPNRAGVTEDAGKRLNRREDMAQPDRAPSEGANGHRTQGVHRRDGDARGAGDAYRSDRARSRERESDADLGREWGHGGRPDRGRVGRDSEIRGSRHGHPEGHHGAAGTGRGERSWNRPGDSSEWSRHQRRPGRERDAAPPATAVFGRSEADVFGKSSAPGAVAEDFPSMIRQPQAGVVRIGRRR